MRCRHIEVGQYLKQHRQQEIDENDAMSCAIVLGEEDDVEGTGEDFATVLYCTARYHSISLHLKLFLSYFIW